MSVPKSHYVSGLVAVHSSNVEVAIDMLGGSVDIAGAEDLLVVDPPTDDDSMGEYQRALELMGNTVQFIKHEDPPAAVEQLRGDADGKPLGSVINAVGFINHWSPFPGTWPRPVDFELDAVRDQTTDEFIGVIDSGIVPDGPQWAAGSLRYSPWDIEILANKDDASHGTFIAGLLRRLACSYGVSVVRLPLVHRSHFTSPGGVPPIFDVSTEYHLYLAIARLLVRNERHPLVGLNLSLGTYTLSSGASVIMKAAIDLWSQEAPASPIFAAAGNEWEKPGDAYEEVWPAAFKQVKGVGAADPSGTEVVWDYHSPSTFAAIKPAPPGARPWVTVTAPGTDIISLSGHRTSAGLPELVSWSGSSFATPIALANYLNGTSAATRHSDVEGLPHAAETPRTVPWGSSACDPSKGSKGASSGAQSS